MIINIFLFVCCLEAIQCVVFVPGSLECGAKVVGTVLFIDLQNNCVELTLNPGIMERISIVQGRLQLTASVIISQ
jgi:hypothetical protein